MTTKTKRASRVRGFVIVVILAVGAVIAAVVAGQLITAQKAQVTGTRISEEARARAIALACLDMVTALAENAPTVNLPVPNPGDDFDALLAGPNGANGDGDDGLPDATTVVTIPANGGPSWSLLDVPGSGGACAVRYDDNSDDGKLAISIPSGDSPGEGTGTDEPSLDRDLSVYATAIGLYPADPTDTAAYGKAHARITLRRLIQLSNMFQPLAPALWANDIDLDNNNDICGAGGAIATGTITTDNNSCICGAVQAPAAPGGSNPVTNGDTCNCPSSQCPPTSVTIAAPTAPPLNVHWASVRDSANAAAEMLDNEGWGKALEIDPAGNPSPTAGGEGVLGDPVTLNDIGDPAICSFYAQVNGRVFVWDNSDNDAKTTLQDFADGTADGAFAAANVLVNVNVASVTDCTSDTSSTFPKPCAWPDVVSSNAGFAADTNTNGVADGVDGFVCAADESPCWKLIARLDDAAGSQGEIGFGALSMNEWTSLGDTEVDWQRTSANNAADLPNVRSAVFNAGQGVAFGPGGLCATAATSCSSCPTTGGYNFTDTLYYHGNDHWHFGNDSDRRYLPEPAIWVLEVAAGQRVAVDDMGQGGTGPYHASIFSTADIDFDSGNSICCATCDCTTLGASTAPGSCDAGGSFGGGNAATISLQSTNAPAGSPAVMAGDVGSALLSRGIALKAYGTVDLEGDLVVGDVRAGTIEMDDMCQIGNLVAYGGAPACSGSGTCSGAHICMDNNATVVGDVESMTSIDAASGGSNNPTIWGSVVAKQDACFKNNARIDGILMAGGTIELKNNALIINSSTSALGVKQVANASMQTFMEATW